MHCGNPHNAQYPPSQCHRVQYSAQWSLPQWTVATALHPYNALRTMWQQTAQYALPQSTLMPTAALPCTAISLIHWKSQNALLFTICALLLLHNMHHKQCASTKHCSHCNMYIVHTPFKSATRCITGMHSPELSPRPAIHWESPLSVGEPDYTQKSHNCSCTNRWCKPKSLPCSLLIYLWEIVWTFI